MNRNRHVSLVALGLWFSITGLASAEPHHATPDFGGASRPASPSENARILKQIRLDHEARVALDAGNYAAEEDYARQSLSLGLGTGLSEKLLAQALKDQGKNQEALRVYEVMVVNQKDSDESDLLPFALLLLRARQWAQAVTIYNMALPRMVNAETLIANSHFSPSTPQPKRLEIALHIAQGILDQHSENWSYHIRLEEGMHGPARALQIQPKAPLTNYYYGYGWKHLDLRSSTRTRTAKQAEAAFKVAPAARMAL